MSSPITECRVCKSKSLEFVINLGSQAFTGYFPKWAEEEVDYGSLELLKCMGECGLVQSKYSFDRNKLYGDNYAYRSGINKTMTNHLENKVKKIREIVQLEDCDLVVDIGSNDATLLKNYPLIEGNKTFMRIGIDPSGRQFQEIYEKNKITILDQFFNKEFFNVLKKKPKVITSIAMFYDLEDPLHFMFDIKQILDKNGIWLMEQSYMPIMLEKNSYDTICHEHIEYYSLSTIKWMADKVGLKIIDVSLNEINGGSFEVILAHKESSYKENTGAIDYLLNIEYNLELGTVKPYNDFRKRILSNRANLMNFMEKELKDERVIYGYGASTKGNVILQYCEIKNTDMIAIADRNPTKWGKVTPGTKIPIISEDEARKKRPDYMLVLPWHFKEEILAREQEYINNGGKLVFPLPRLIVEKK